MLGHKSTMRRCLEETRRTFPDDFDRVISRVERFDDKTNGLVAVPLRGTLVECTEGICALLGYSPTEIEGKTILDFIPRYLHLYLRFRIQNEIEGPLKIVFNDCIDDRHNCEVDVSTITTESGRKLRLLVVREAPAQESIAQSG